MSDHPIEPPSTRVVFRERQLLRSRDLQDDQTYHRGQLLAHNLAAHRPGVLRGLAPSFSEEEGSFVVEPGVAIMPDGVAVAVADRRRFPPSVFDEKESDRLLVHLTYEDVFESTVSTDPRCCPPARDGGDRSRVLGSLRLSPPGLAAGAGPDPRSIFLGALVRDPASEPPYGVDLARRQYAGVVAGAVVAPSGTAKLRIGDDEDVPFEVSVVRREGAAPEPALRIEASGAIEALRSLRVQSDLHVAEGALSFDRVDGDVGFPPGFTGRHWSIYRETGPLPLDALPPLEPARQPVLLAPAEGGEEGVLLLEKLVQAEQKPPSDRPEVAQLRVDVPDGASFVVGTTDEAEEEFRPILEVSSEGGGLVRVYGDLEATGFVRGSRQPATLSNEALNLMSSGVFLGSETADQILAAFQSVPLFDSVEAVAGLLSSNDAYPRLQAGLAAASNRLVQPAGLGGFLLVLFAAYGAPAFAEKLREARLELLKDEAQRKALLAVLVSGVPHDGSAGELGITIEELADDLEEAGADQDWINALHAAF